jgi:hypothetical protein
MGVKQLMMMWRTPLGYSMSSRREKGRKYALRMWRVVIGSVTPLIAWNFTGLVASMTVSA